MVILKTKEQEFLQQHFWVASPAAVSNGQTFAAQDLLSKKRALTILNQLAEQLGSDSMVTVAAQLAKKYAYMLVVPVLYTMSAMNKGLNPSIKNTRFCPKWENGNSFFDLKLKNWSVSIPLNGRETWREHLVRELFRDHIAVVWQALHLFTGVPLSILWENTATYVYWLYEQKLADMPPGIRERAQEDFQYLLHEAPAEFFLEQVQPFARFHGEKVAVPWSEKPIRIRKTCCLYYQLDAEGQCCHNCPRKCIN